MRLPPQSESQPFLGPILEFKQEKIQNLFVNGGRFLVVMNLPDDMKFRETVCWSMISSGKPSFRWFPSGGLVEHASSGLFDSRLSLFWLLAFCNSSVATAMLALISPTLNYEVSKIGSLPVLRKSTVDDSVDTLSLGAISASKSDWDSFETSWDFKRHPLL